jgi:hypothetical protein
MHTPSNSLIKPKEQLQAFNFGFPNNLTSVQVPIPVLTLPADSGSVL